MRYAGNFPRKSNNDERMMPKNSTMVLRLIAFEYERASQKRIREIIHDEYFLLKQVSFKIKQIFFMLWQVGVNEAKPTRKIRRKR